MYVLMALTLICLCHGLKVTVSPCRLHRDWVWKCLLTNLSKSEINVYCCKCSVKEKQLFFPLCAELAGMLIDDSLRWAASSTERSLAPECNNCIYHCLPSSPFTETWRPTGKRLCELRLHSAFSKHGRGLRSTSLNQRNQRETIHARWNFQAYCKGFIRSLWKSRYTVYISFFL